MGIGPLLLRFISSFRNAQSLTARDSWLPRPKFPAGSIRSCSPWFPAETPQRGRGGMVTLFESVVHDDDGDDDEEEDGDGDVEDDDDDYACAESSYSYH